MIARTLRTRFSGVRRSSDTSSLTAATADPASVPCGTGRAPRPAPHTGGTGRFRPGLLGVLALLFLITGLARIGTGTASALDAALTADLTADAQAAEPGVAAAPDTPETPMELFETLRVREKQLIASESALAARQDALRAAEGDLARQLDDLAAMERQLAQTLALADEAAERDLARLTAVFESMRARDAAELFEEMDVEFAAGFIGRLRPETAAEIMAGLTPLSAYAISAVLAGRNANVPRN